MEKNNNEVACCNNANSDVEILDHVSKLYMHIVSQQQYEKKRLFAARCTMMLTAGMLAVLLTVSLILVPPLVRTVRGAQSVVEELNTLDLAALSDQANSFISQAGSSLMAIDMAVKQLESLNIDNMNKAIDSLTIAVQSLSNINVAKLNEAISNLNDTVAPFARFFGKF